MSKNISALSSRRGGLEKNLFEEITRQKQATGTSETEALNDIAEDFLIGEAPLLGAASFYDFLKRDHAGKKILICNGTACLVAGTQQKLRERLSEHFAADEIGEICCLGRCHENSSFQYGGENYSGEACNNLKGIINNGKNGHSTDCYPQRANIDPPLLMAEFPGIETYYSLFDSLLKKDAGNLITEMNASKLRGRGGAGFPAGFKWDACRKVPGDQKYIVCNADEGDPGAYTDRYLMEERPHAVLFGMLVAGLVAGADTGVLYIRAEYPESIAVIRNSIDELRNAGYLGQNIRGSNFSFEFKVVVGAGAYICGEETALLASLEGQRPEVRVRPPYPTVEGLFRKPTIVNNVETFACVHSIFTLGGAAFAIIGTEKSTGTKLVSLDGNFNTPGCYEIEMGTPLRVVLDEFGGGFKVPVKAVHIGGPLGGLVPVHKIGDLTLDFESFDAHGFLLGHAGIVAVPESFPMLQYMEHLFEFTAAESCGKCFPCRLGSVRGQELLHKARTSEFKIDRELLDDLVETLEETSLCALGGGVPLPIRNALQYFEDELRPYFLEEAKQGR